MERRKRRKAVRKSREIRKRIFFVLTLTMIVCLGTLALGGQNEKSGIVTYESILIQAGDTVWNIAQEFKMEDEDTEHMVDKIMEINDMCSANIKAGQRIIVPVERIA